MADTFYYVNNTGSGSGAGTIEDPWVPSQVTGAAPFDTGDHILFYHTDIITGTQFGIADFGSAEKPVVYGRYGGISKPKIHFDGGDTFSLGNNAQHVDFVSLHVNSDTTSTSFFTSGTTTNLRWFDVDCSGCGSFIWENGNGILTGHIYGGRLQYSTRDMISFANTIEFNIYGTEINRAGFTTGNVIGSSIGEGDAITMHSYCNLEVEDVNILDCKRALSNVQDSGVFHGKRMHIRTTHAATTRATIVSDAPVLQYGGGTTILDSCVIAATGGYATYIFHIAETGHVRLNNCAVYDALDHAFAGTWVNQGNMEIYNSFFQMENSVNRLMAFEGGAAFIGENNAYEITGDTSHAVFQLGSQDWDAYQAAKEPTSIMVTGGSLISPEWWRYPDTARLLPGSPLINAGANRSDHIHFTYNNDTIRPKQNWHIGPFDYPQEVVRKDYSIGLYGRYGFAPS